MLFSFYFYLNSRFYHSYYYYITVIHSVTIITVFTPIYKERVNKKLYIYQCFFTFLV